MLNSRVAFFGLAAILLLGSVSPFFSPLSPQLAYAGINPGSITVVKQIGGSESLQKFNFTVYSSSNTSLVYDQFFLDDAAANNPDDNVNYPDQKTVSSLVPGLSYRVLEAKTDGFDIEDAGDLVCVNNVGVSTFSYNIAEQYVDVTLAEGGDVTCTFTNIKIPNLAFDLLRVYNSSVATEGLGTGPVCTIDWQSDLNAANYKQVVPGGTDCDVPLLPNTDYRLEFVLVNQANHNPSTPIFASLEDSVGPDRLLGTGPTTLGANTTTTALRSAGTYGPNIAWGAIINEDGANDVDDDPLIEDYNAEPLAGENPANINSGTDRTFFIRFHTGAETGGQCTTMFVQDEDARENESVDICIGLPAQVTVVKEVKTGGDVGAISDTDFNFVFSSNTSVEPVYDEFTLDDDGNNGSINNDYNKTKTYLIGAGNYTITEIENSLWDITDILCTGASDSSETSNSASIEILDGQQVTCIFSNEELTQPQLTVAKTIISSSTSVDNTEFNFEFSSNTSVLPFSLFDGNYRVFSSLTTTGTYNVTEAENDNYRTISSCNSNEKTGFAPIDMLFGFGEVATCDFYNIKNSTLTVYKQGNLPAPFVGPFNFTFSSDTTTQSNYVYEDVREFGVANNDSYGPISFYNGTWNLMETDPGFVSTVICTGFEQNLIDVVSSQSPLQLDILPGQNILCTYVNNQPFVVTVTGESNQFPVTKYITITGPNDLNIDCDLVDLQEPGIHTCEGLADLVSGEYTIEETLVASDAPNWYAELNCGGVIEPITSTQEGDLINTWTIQYDDENPFSCTLNNYGPVAADDDNGGCSDCAPPTLGVNAEGRRIVTNGFTYNGESVDAQLFFTPYPLITTEVGKENVAKLKIYENTGIDYLRHVELIFGLKKGGENLSEAKVSIIWEKDWQLNESFYVVDPENKLDKDTLSVTSAEVLCTTAANDDWCTELTITHTFREAPDFDAVGVRTWDANLYTWDYTFNHGIHVTGDSLNPSDELYIASPDRHARGLIHVTEVDSLNNIWQADNGYLYQMNDFGTFILISDVKVDKISDVGEAKNREHSAFASLKESEANKAKSVWDSQNILSKLGPSFTYEYPTEDSRTKFLKEHNLLDWIKGN